MTELTPLRQALDRAGKLKQFCGSVLDVIGAAENLVSMEQICTETEARVVSLRAQEQQAQQVLTDVQQAIQTAKGTAKDILAAARADAEQVVAAARVTAQGVTRDAEQAAANAYEIRGQVEADIAAHRKTIVELQAATQYERDALSKARAAVEALLKR